MRVLSKLPIPQVLADNAPTWLAEYKADRASASKKYKYRHAEIKGRLRDETAWKCVYCESRIGHNTPGDVEHKVPSSKNEDLHFEWTNLTIACTECNRRKNDYYEEGEEFLDPYAEDVEACLVHLGPIVHWTPGHARAEITVRTLNLDSGRPALFDRKKDVLEKVRALLGQVEIAGGNPLLQALRADEVARMAAIDAEFSAMVRTYVKLTPATIGTAAAAAQPIV